MAETRISPVVRALTFAALALIVGCTAQRQQVVVSIPEPLPGNGVAAYLAYVKGLKLLAYMQLGGERATLETATRSLHAARQLHLGMGGHIVGAGRFGVLVTSVAGNGYIDLRAPTLSIKRVGGLPLAVDPNSCRVAAVVDDSSGVALQQYDPCNGRSTKTHLGDAAPVAAAYDGAGGLWVTTYKGDILAIARDGRVRMRIVAPHFRLLNLFGDSSAGVWYYDGDKISHVDASGSVISAPLKTLMISGAAIGRGRLLLGIDDGIKRPRMVVLMLAGDQVSIVNVVTRDHLLNNWSGVTADSVDSGWALSDTANEVTKVRVLPSI